MRELKLSTARDVMVFMALASDHVTGATGLTLTITASKNGAAFGSITPTVTERGNGWYSLALTASHTDTLGDFALHITGTAADPADALCHVVGELSGVLTSTANSAVATAWGARVLGNSRTADYYLQGGANKVVRTSSAFTVYLYDDSTALMTAVATNDGSFLPLASIDPT